MSKRCPGSLAARFRAGHKPRLTFGQSFAISPIWSPDANRLIFGLNRDGRYDLYEKPANGAKDEEVVLKSSGSKTPTSWSRDGRFLLYTEVDPTTKNDVCVLPLEGRKPMPFLHAEYNEDEGRFSSDGRFVAYVSDESGGVRFMSASFRRRRVEASGWSPRRAEPTPDGERTPRSCSTQPLTEPSWPSM